MIDSWIQAAKEIRETDGVMLRLFEKPKCKPWDIAKGRRLPCCHGLGGHTQGCFEGMKGKMVRIPFFSEITSEDLVSYV